MAGDIPLKNIYYLLSYAWDQLEQSDLINLSTSGSLEILDLLADILIKGTEHLTRRGLEQGYIEITEATPSIKGQVHIYASERRMLFQHSQALCTFDQMTVDTPANRVLKATLAHLSKVETVSETLRKKASKLVRQLPEIGDIKFNRLAFRGIQLHQNNRFYRFVLNVCELILDASLLCEETGSYRVRDFIKDEHRIRRLFEAFLRNFYKRHLPQCNVKAEKVRWWAESDTDPALSLLPGMITDISIRDKKNTLIIDAKFKKSAFQRNFDKSSFHSTNLYQLFAYLKNLEMRNGVDSSASGMLIYPLVNDSVCEDYRIHGHKISIRTVDLTNEWPLIESSLLEFVPQFA